MGRSRRTGAHRAHSLARQMKAKRRRPDLDEIHRELRPLGPARPQPDPDAEPDLDLPGGGLHRCLACAKYFIDSANLKTHFRSKDHKKRYEGVRRGLMDGCSADRAFTCHLPTPVFLSPRLKQLSVEPYSQEEAERAAGMGSYVPPRRLAVPTEVSTEVPEMDTST
ncbi:PREDICTED: zinc finger protein 593 isoform X1 [Mandrillus leucophaeus]|uniref:zinc finger protein 593 isoform X1 n=1 Tax=Mandrillus leucophaeus TaxID=9568 RepID=UPI0005F4AC73|nr:PREDICTED: zinc finger protein 593 isoform X1 [Mandrillus leucophaeus]